MVCVLVYQDEQRKHAEEVGPHQEEDARVETEGAEHEEREDDSEPPAAFAPRKEVEQRDRQRELDEEVSPGEEHTEPRAARDVERDLGQRCADNLLVAEPVLVSTHRQQPIAYRGEVEEKRCGGKSGQDPRGGGGRAERRACNLVQHTAVSHLGDAREEVDRDQDRHKTCVAEPRRAARVGGQVGHGECGDNDKEEGGL